MELVRSLRFRFVRYCVNRAYAEVDISKLPAEVANFYDDVVSQIRDLERRFTSYDAIVRTLRTELAEKLRLLREREPELTARFVEKMVDNCLELEEVAESGLREVFEEIRRTFAGGAKAF